MSTISLHRAWTMHLETYEAIVINPEQEKVFAGYLIFITGIWLVGLIICTIISFKHIYDVPKDKYTWRCELKYLKWYFRTWLNRFVLVLWFAIGMCSFGIWYGSEDDETKIENNE